MVLESELSWLLWAVPLGIAALIAVGWWLRGLEQRQWQTRAHTGPQAYFRGLSHLLNEQQDEAIDAFIEATQQDADTSELHFALGNLFRRRGDYDRAIRVHEHLLQRADLKLSDRHRAQHELALDFLKAGLLDRAEAAMKELADTPLAEQAQLALLGIYERARDWPQAASVAAQLDGTQAGNFSARMAHYACEMAHEASLRGDIALALDTLEQVLKKSPKHARTMMAIAELQEQQGQAEAATRTLLHCVAQQPQVLPLAAAQFTRLAAQVPDQVDAILAVLSSAFERQPSIDITMALLQLRPGQTAHWLSAHLAKEQSLQIAAQALSTVENLPEHSLEAVQHAASPLQRYRCAACGFEAHRYFWQCPGCQSWDSFPALRAEEL